MVETPHSETLSGPACSRESREVHVNIVERWRKWIAVLMFVVLLIVAVYALLYRLPDEMTAAKCATWMVDNPKTALYYCQAIKGAQLLNATGGLLPEQNLSGPWLLPTG